MLLTVKALRVAPILLQQDSGRDTPVILLAMAVLETPNSRKRRETPSEPFGRPSFRPEDLALARASRMASRTVIVSGSSILGGGRPGDFRLVRKHVARFRLGPGSR